MARPKKVVEVVVEELAEKIVEKVKTQPVTLISYTMGAVIPTMQYGNIQPSITVSAGSIQEAEDVCLAHIENLFAMFTKKEEEVLPVVNVPKDVAIAKKETVAITTGPGCAFRNAHDALIGAKGEEAKNFVRMKIQNSMKLSKEEKRLLLELE